MNMRNLQTAWALLLCLSLILTPASAWAQKGKAPAENKVNLNTATVEQLQTLPGIGVATAQRILELRSKVGKFTKIEEILNVKGIGEKKFQKIKDRLII